MIDAEKEFYALERELATDNAEIIIMSSAADHEGDWWNIQGHARTYDCEREDMKKAARYLEIRGLLKRHPENENLVRLMMERNDEQ